MRVVQVRPDLPATNPSLPAFLDCWMAARQGDALPFDADLMALAAERGLPTGNMALIEVRAPDLVVVRRSGSVLDAHLGFGLAGFDIMQATAASVRATRFARFLLNATHPCGVVVRDLALDDRRGQAVESLNLPVRGEKGETCILSLVVGFETRPHGRDRIMYGDFHSWIDLGHGIPSVADELAAGRFFPKSF